MKALNGVFYKNREVRCNDADEGGKGRASEAPKGRKTERKKGRGRDNQDVKWYDQFVKKGKNDWRELINNKPLKLKGEEPDFTEEGWARRKPKR